MSADQLEAQQQMHHEQAERDLAMSGAAEAGVDQAIFGGERTLLGEIGDADIDAPASADKGDIIEVLSAELSKHNALGNITRDEYEKRKLVNEMLAMRVKAEFPQRAGVSSKCIGDYRRELLGGDAGDKKRLPPKLARKIDTVLGEEGVRSQMTSLSIGAKAFDGVTTAKSYAEIGSSGSSDTSSGGIMQSAKSFLGFGGDNS